MPKTWGQVMEAAVRFGPVTIILAGLLYWMTTSLDARLDSQSQRLDQHVATTHELVEQIKESNQMNWQLLGVAQRICLNTAKTDSDRLSCVVKPEGR
jgi:uncharacterized membrane-anchored protein YhcB (DUF1043 family)